MPELPEVETVVRGLEDRILGARIIETEIQENKIVGYPKPELFKSRSEDLIIEGLKRRGKFIIIKLTGAVELVIHLRMTGKLLIKDRKEEIAKHTHVIFRFDDGRDLRFNNVRKFGRVYLVDESSRTQAGNLVQLGPEPLESDFTLDKFIKLLANRRGQLKPLLMKQEFIAGLGNIYTDEILFEAGIAPDRKADSLSETEIKKLYYAIQEVLQRGIKFCGTTVSDYVNCDGEQGSFQEKLQVYQKGGESCPACSSDIIKEKIGGRATHYCPVCQQ